MPYQFNAIRRAGGPPNYLSEFDDEITEAQFQEWYLRHQVETKITYMENDVPVDVFDAYSRR